MLTIRTKQQTTEDEPTIFGDSTAYVFLLLCKISFADDHDADYFSRKNSQLRIYSDTDIQMYSSSLSAYLYKATLNETYLSAAQDSGGFMVDIIDITGPNNGLAAISANVSASCSDTFGPGDFRIDQAGFFLEGLAVLSGDVYFGQQNLSVDTL